MKGSGKRLQGGLDKIDSKGNKDNRAERELLEVGHSCCAAVFAVWHVRHNLLGVRIVCMCMHVCARNGAYSLSSRRGVISSSFSFLCVCVLLCLNSVSNIP